MCPTHAVEVSHIGRARVRASWPGGHRSPTGAPIARARLKHSCVAAAGLARSIHEPDVSTIQALGNRSRGQRSRSGPTLSTSKLAAIQEIGNRGLDHSSDGRRGKMVRPPIIQIPCCSPTRPSDISHISPPDQPPARIIRAPCSARFRFHRASSKSAPGEVRVTNSAESRCNHYGAPRRSRICQAWVGGRLERVVWQKGAMSVTRLRSIHRIRRTWGGTPDSPTPRVEPCGCSSSAAPMT